MASPYGMLRMRRPQRVRVEYPFELDMIPVLLAAGLRAYDENQPRDPHTGEWTEGEKEWVQKGEEAWEHQSDKDVIGHVTKKVTTEAGAEKALAAVAGAFRRLPESLRPVAKRNINQVVLRKTGIEHISSAEGEIKAAGLYDPNAKVMTIAADTRETDIITSHELAHAIDRRSTGRRGAAAMGTYSNKPAFRKIQKNILASGANIAPHYNPSSAPDAVNPNWAMDMGRREMFAQLASEYMNGAMFDLSPTRTHHLPVSIGIEITQFFQEQLGPVVDISAEAYEEPDDLGCAAVEHPDGTIEYLLVKDGSVYESATGGNV